MTETSFTEAPWQSQHDFDMQGVCRIIGAIDGPDDGRFHYKVICEIDPDGSLDTKEQYANARLIAAAPKLYELLARASEEMRLIEMKDCGAIYDVGLRSEIRSALLLSNTGGTGNG